MCGIKRCEVGADFFSIRDFFLRISFLKDGLQEMKGELLKKNLRALIISLFVTAELLAEVGTFGIFEFFQ